MMKSTVNFVFFVIIITIFLFFLCSPDVHGFRTPMPISPLREDRNFNTVSRPVYITPSNVRVIQSDSTPPVDPKNKNGFFADRGSPTDSIAASTIFGVPTEFPHISDHQSLEYKDNNPLMNNINLYNKQLINNPVDPKINEQFNKNINKRKESVGERICHKIFYEFVVSKIGKNKDIMRNIRPNFLKNPKTGHNLELDMFEAFDDRIVDKNSIIDGIAIEYNGLQHDQYVPGMHNNIEAYNEQQFRDEYKTKVCKEKGIILIVIDTKLDISRIPIKDAKGRRKFITFTENQRESTIREVLIPQLEEAYKELMLKRRSCILR